MKNRLAETRSATFELLRHFLGRVFESELATTPGQWRKAAIGLVAGIVPAALLAYPMFVHRYTCVAVQTPARECPAIGNYSAAYASLVQADASWLISLAICITAMVTALQWQSLFPSRRDVLALASLPVSPREIFAAKFGALLVAFAVFVLALNGVPAALFAQVIVSPWQTHSTGWNLLANFAAMSAGCGFAFFSLLALQGVLLAALPARVFERVSVAAQALVFTASVAALPFLWGAQSASAWWPVNWFLALREGHMRAAAIAVASPAACALAVYLVGFYRYQRLLLESARRRDGGRELRLGSRALEAFIDDPREQAIFAFLGKTLLRSRTHQLVLQMVAGLAVAWIVQGVHDARGSGVEATVILGPIAAAAFLIAGLRYLFSLPAELRANWLFQSTEAEGRVAWLRATDRFVIVCVVAPIYLCAIPVALMAFGWQEAARLLLMSFVMALALFEFWFREWRKLPFACSHLSGERPFWLLMVVGMGVLSYLGTAAIAIYETSRGWVPFAAVFPAACALWLKLRNRRRKTWEETSLIYEEQPAAAVSGLDIHFERGSEIASPASDFEPTARSTPLWNSFREAGAGASDHPFPADDRAMSAFFGLRGLWEDVRYGLRLMRKNAALSAGVTFTLALGIGMNVSVLTLINGLAFRARVEQPETFVQVAFPYSGQVIGVGRVSPQEYEAYRDRTRSIESLAAAVNDNVLLGHDRSNEAHALLVSCNFFAVYHLRSAKIGRLFSPEECATPGGAPVAVLSEEAWRDRFGADPHIVGQMIPIDDQGFTVIGIAPAHHPARVNGAAVWLPYTAQPLIDPTHDIFRNRTPALMVGGRLARGVSRAAAQAEWNVMVEQDDRQTPGRKTKVAITDGSAISMIATGASQFYVLFLLLMGGPWAVLLITCANVTTMLLSRAVARRREIAVRLSLGAPRMRLLRMLLMESCLLAAVAGAAALYIAYRVPAPLFQYLTDEAPAFPLAPDWRIFTFVFGVVLLTGCLAGVAPALESLRVNLTASLKGYFGGSVAGGVPVRSVLVSAQVALGLVLLVCAGLLAGADRRVYGGEPDFETRRVLVTPLHFPARSSAVASMAIYRNLEARIQALPGVQSVTHTDDIPFLGTPVRIRRPAADGDAMVTANAASPGYLQTLGIPLVAGRDFQEGDRASGPAPLRAIVSQSFARTFLAGRFPVGQHFENGPSVSFDIIGVAKDVNAGGDDRLAIYLFPDWSAYRTDLLVRVAGDPRSAAEAVRNAVRSAYPDFLVTPRPLQALFDERYQVQRRLVILLLILAGIAVVLAVAGIYGVVTLWVTQRTRELGIRVALGARPGQITGDVLRSSLKPVAYGLFAGVWLALLVETAVKATFSSGGMHFDTGNPAVYLAGVLLLAVAAFAAIIGPARRGAKADPLQALHYE